MKLTLPILVLLAAVIPAGATSINTSVICQAEDRVSQGATLCGAYDTASRDSPWPSARAETAAGAFAGEWSDTAPYTYRAWATTLAAAYANGNLSASGRSTASLNKWLTTDGPVRNGWMDLVISVDSGQSRSGGVGEGNATVGNKSGPTSGRFAFTLGQAFEVDLWSQSMADMSERVFSLSPATGSNLVNVRFTLYEANGVTRAVPREVSAPTAIPEPAGMGIIGLAVVILMRLIRPE